MYGILEEEKMAEYKVGDTVKVVKAGWEEGGSSPSADVGSVDTVSRVSDVAVYGQKWAYYLDEIEPYTKPTFSPGDTVRVKSASKKFVAGDTGRVLGIEGERVSVFGDIYACWIAADKLELVESGETMGDILHRALDIAHESSERDAKPKFKAGDLVRMLEDDWLGYYGAGDTFTLTGASAGGVEFVDGEGEERWRPIEEVELVQLTQDNEPTASWSVVLDDGGDIIGISKDHPCIVARVVDGTPRPSNIPYVHSSVQAATAEAERLARSNPGQEFAVYQRVTARVAEVHVKMREVA